MKCGSVDSLKVCDRWGARANACQIRETADWDIPVAAALTGLTSALRSSVSPAVS